MGLRAKLKAALPQESLLYNALLAIWAVATLSRPRLKRAMRRFRGDGIFDDVNELYMCSLLPSRVLNVVLAEFQPRTMLDVGCGTGQTLRYCVERGVDVTGVEGSVLAIERATIPSRIQLVDLRRPLDLGRRFDVAWSFEVAEHLPPQAADTFVDTLARHSDRIALSAARPGQWGVGHFNCQPPEYWIQKFTARGFRYDVAMTQRMHETGDEHASNMLAFTRGAGTTS